MERKITFAQIKQAAAEAYAEAKNVKGVLTPAISRIWPISTLSFSA